MTTATPKIKPRKRKPKKKKQPAKKKRNDIATPKALSHIFSQKPANLTDDQITEAVRMSLRGDAHWDGMVNTLMRTSVVFFAQEMLSGPIEPPYNGKFLIGEHHKEWDDLLKQHDRLCVLAPRDHGKSHFFSFAYPIWKATYQKDGCGFIFSATQEQAIDILARIKSEFESNPRLQHLVPEKGDKKRWAQRQIELTNGHKIYARGYGTKVRGAHPNWVVVDDGLNDETAYSALVRKKQIDYFLSAISNLVVPGGQLVVVGTPFHQSDLYGQLSENSEYFFQRYQAYNGTEERPLWPARYSKDRLNSKRNEIGTIQFTREFQCLPISDAMSLFPSHLFKGDPVEQFTVKLGMPKKFWDALGVTAYIGVDFAMSSSIQADFTVIWVMGLDQMGNRWIMDIVRGKGLPYQQQLSLINSSGKKYDPALVYLEANQMQRIFGDELIRTTDLPIKKFVTTGQKHTLDKGVPSLRVLLENKKFRIPRGDNRSVELTDLWIDEMQAITWDEGKLVSVGHDDLPMACWVCDQAIRQGGFSYDFGQDVEPTVNFDQMVQELYGERDETSEVGVPGEEQHQGNLIEESTDMDIFRERMPDVSQFHNLF